MTEQELLSYGFKQQPLAHESHTCKEFSMVIKDCLGKRYLLIITLLSRSPQERDFWSAKGYFKTAKNDKSFHVHHSDIADIDLPDVLNFFYQIWRSTGQGYLAFSSPQEKS